MINRFETRDRLAPEAGARREMKATTIQTDPEAELQLRELAAAVRDHEETLRRNRLGAVRAPDARLYRRLRQICGGGGASLELTPSRDA